MVHASTMIWQPLVQEMGLSSPDDSAQPAPAPASRSIGVPAADFESDLDLAEACRRGNLGAYEALYARHGTRMKSIALNLLGNTADAEDAVQEVFLKVHRGIGNFRGQSAFSTWIYRILINACYDIGRKRKRRQEDPEPESEEGEPLQEPSAPKHDHPLRMAIEKSLAQLHPDYRRVFVLFEIEGFSHAEIAGMMDISEAASKNKLYQAKQHLRRMLTQSRAVEEARP